jgi:hypothetical protein
LTGNCIKEGIKIQKIIKVATCATHFGTVNNNKINSSEKNKKTKQDTK